MSATKRKAKQPALAASPWRNRIVGTGERPAREFTPNPENPRRHPVGQREALRGILSEVGWVTGVIENVTTGNLIDGHARIEEALQIGPETPVPFIQVELSEAEERLMLASLDPLGALAAYDRESLDALLREIDAGDGALAEMLEGLARQNQLYSNVTDDPTAQWNGMPEFEQNDQRAYRSIHVHFATQEDVDAFSKVINQTISEKTRYLWFPYTEKRRKIDEVYGSE